MRIGATVSEIVDGSSVNTVPTDPGLQTRGDLSIISGASVIIELTAYFNSIQLEWNCRIRRLKVGIGRNLLVLQGHDDFDDTSKTADRLGMTNVSFHRTYWQRIVALASS